LVSVLLIFAGIVVEGRISSNRNSEENLKTYKAILNLESALQEHIIQTGRIP